MAWSCIRIVLFTTAFLVGLLFFGPDRSSSHTKTSTIAKPRQHIEVKCSDSKFSLVNEGGKAREVRCVQKRWVREISISDM
jgi:hypothetical protein